MRNGGWAKIGQHSGPKFSSRATLLAAAQAEAREVKPEALGQVGPKAYDASEVGYACQCGAFAYGWHDPRATIPFVVEAWVSVRDRTGTGAGITVYANRTKIVSEVWAYRSADKKLVISDRDLYLSIELPKGACSIVLHIASPFIPIQSIGKSPDLSVFEEEIGEAIQKAFTRSRKRLLSDMPTDEDGGRVTQKSLVLRHLNEAAAALSENGTYAFGQRNLFYRVRPHVEQALDGRELRYENFCQILTDFEAEHGDIPGLVRDPRGSVYDMRGETPLGTAAVDRYEREPWLFHKVLFCEKEDHKQILMQAGWPQRHDCAIISSKGFASRAARDWIDKVADTGEPVIVFCIHDADAAGTMIAQTLQEATRARPRRLIEIVDIGLQPWDAVEMGLPVESVSYKDPQPVANYVASRYDGAHWKAWLQEHRVELNAMSPRQMIQWLDEHVERRGALKLVPPPDVAEGRLHRRLEALIEEQETERVLREAQERIRAETQRRLAEAKARLPNGDGLVGGVRDQVTHEREMHWTDAVELRAEEAAQESA